MDAVRECTCDRCGQANPWHSLWCRECGAPVSFPIDPSATDPSQEKSLATAIDLYGRVLADLNGLADRAEVPAATYETIKSFYAERLAATQSQEEASRHAVAVQKYVRRARSLAHATAPRLQEAIYVLVEGLKKLPDEPVLLEMVREIDARIKQTEQAVHAVQAARNLLNTLATSWGTAELEKMEDRLKEARKLIPENEHLVGALARVRTLIEEKKRGPPIVEATLVPESPVSQPAENWLTSASEPSAAPIPFAPEPLGKGRLAARTAARAPARPSFAEEEEIPSPVQRWVEAASEWSKILKPLLLDNVGWFLGVFLIIAGFIVLITTFWKNIEQNQVLMFSLVYLSLMATTGLFFALAYFLRVKYPQLETSSNVLLIIVALLIPLVFAAAALTTLVPPA